MVELGVRLVLSLAVVVGLMLLLARMVGRHTRGRDGGLVQVLHRQPLSRGSGVSVVAVGSRVLVLGTTEQQVRVLAELDPDELPLAGAPVLRLSAAAGADLADDLADELTDAERGGPDATSRPSAPRRGAHRAGAARVARPGVPLPAEGPLAGSVLSAQTWRQALAAATRRAS